MKRYVAHVESLYAELLTDAAYAYPTLVVEFDRDLRRLTRLLNTRGLPFAMVDLPAQGKHLDRCLACGQYSPSNLPGQKPVGGGVVIPKLLRGLYLLVFEPHGQVKENADVQAVFFLRQLLYGVKKATVRCPEENVAKEISAFVLLDNELTVPSEWWKSPHHAAMVEEHTGFASRGDILDRLGSQVGRPRAFRLLRNLDRIAGVLSSALGPYDPMCWRFAHGPGVVSDVYSFAVHDDPEDFESCPDDHNRYRFPVWSERLESVFPLAECAYYNLASWADDPRLEAIGSYEPMSRLIDVPKTYTKPRLIAVEPASHMWCQKNIQHYLYERVAASWIGEFIDFRSQERNQMMALVGSRDNSFATIDLSAASDRISCRVVGDMFRANHALLMALAASRTRYCKIGNEPIELRKYATMGNATTFPVQSLIFLAVALSSLATGHDADRVTPSKLRLYSGLVSVFGDDIVVPESHAREVVCLLEALGFKVNADKSFLTGPFKESCGVDAFRGNDVSPIYWQGPCLTKQPESIASTIEVANNFYSRLLVHTSVWVERCVGRIKFPYVSPGSGVAGFHSFCVPALPPLKRWNKALQEEEVRVNSFSSLPRTLSYSDDTSLHQFFTEDPSLTEPWKAGVRLKPLLKIRRRWVSTAQLQAVVVDL